MRSHEGTSARGGLTREMTAGSGYPSSMDRVLRRIGFILALSVAMGLYLILFLEAGWDSRTSTGIFVLTAAAMGAAIVTLAALAALWWTGRGRSAGMAPFAAALGALAAGIAALLALEGMPVGTRGERAVVYWTAVVAALGVLGVGWVILRRR